MKNQYLVRVPRKDLKATMNMFDVPKGANDVRMVYDGTKSRLNDSLWAPWFALPTVEGLARNMVSGSWFADNDFADQFLFFNLHPASLQEFCGIDLSRLFPECADENEEFFC
mmetsp:Transcript_2973/g.4171  ORF Transcript_2973/g.4171 Transcript_2973/m.4171 type:complete len:112 (-) Transcript_2973:370-705(-)